MANRFRDIPVPTEVLEQEPAPKAKATPSPAKKQKPRKKGVLAKGLSSIFSGSFLSNEKTLQNLPFIVFLAMLALLYIANGYYADDKVREANKISNQLKDLRSDYVLTKSELMFTSKQSEVAKAVEPLGLKEPVVPPMKIEVDSILLFPGTE